MPVSVMRGRATGHRHCRLIFPRAAGLERHAAGPENSLSLTPSEVRVIVIGAMLALFLAALDQTIVATALPPIANDLGDFALISWVVTAYLLTSTCATPIVGKLATSMAGAGS